MKVWLEEGTVGVAWRLRAPSASGGKVYTIAVIGSTLVTAWGRATAAGRNGAGSQGSVVAHSSAAGALAAAQVRTAEKESGGYALEIEPKRVTFTDIPVPDTFDALNATMMILRNGERL